MRVPLAHYPGMNRFVLDWLGGDERFLRRASASPRHISADATNRRAALVEPLIESNRRWGIFAGDALRKWATGETLTIIAGQQVGFAGGPLYTLAKLATLVRFKRDMAKQGIAVTPFFWLATEDHDFDEVATLNVPSSAGQLDLLCIRAVRTADARAAVGPLPVPEELVTQLLAAVDLPRPQWLREGITFRDSFAELVASIFGNEVILVDSLLPELRRAGAPLFEQIRARQSEVQRALHDRGSALAAAGYSEQVIPRDGANGDYTLFFRLDEENRRHPCTSEAVAAEQTSTSALTRPLLQDYVFTPDIFVGGPAEVAYYAQISALHELLGVPMPRVALRGHVLVVTRSEARAFERYAIDPKEIFDSPDHILAEREPENVIRIRRLTDEAKRDLMAKIEEIAELALPAEHSLAGSFERSIGHLEYHFDKLSMRAIQGLVRKDRERLAAVKRLVSTLYPDRHVQERIVSWFAWWCRYGQTVVDRIVEDIEMDSDHFRIVNV